MPRADSAPQKVPTPNGNEPLNLLFDSLYVKLHFAADRGTGIVFAASEVRELRLYVDTLERIAIGNAMGLEEFGDPIEKNDSSV